MIAVLLIVGGIAIFGVGVLVGQLICPHNWHVVAKDVCTGSGKRVTVMECRRCGKLKVK